MHIKCSQRVRVEPRAKIAQPRMQPHMVHTVGASLFGAVLLILGGLPSHQNVGRLQVAMAHAQGMQFG